MTSERPFGTEISANRRHNYKLTLVQRAVIYSELSSGKKSPCCRERFQHHTLDKIFESSEVIGKTAKPSI